MGEEQIISEFNEAKFQIARLHNLWLKSSYQRASGDLVSCQWTLDSAELELINDIKRLDSNKKDNNYKEQLDKINKELNESKEEKKPGKFYLKLKEKEELLRVIQDLAGKGARYKDLDEDGMI